MIVERLIVKIIAVLRSRGRPLDIPIFRPIVATLLYDIVNGVPRVYRPPMISVFVVYTRIIIPGCLTYHGILETFLDVTFLNVSPR
jgi:hypothetical protein